MKVQQWSVTWTSGDTRIYTRLVVDDHPAPTEVEMRAVASELIEPLGEIKNCVLRSCSAVAPTTVWDPAKQALVPLYEMFVVQDGVCVPRRKS